MTRPTLPRPGLMVATILGIMSLLIGASFLARSRAVAGPVVRQQLASWASRHDATLHVGGMRPTGLFGIRLDDVTLRLSRGPATVGLDSGTLEVRPSLSALFRGRAALGHLRLQGGDVWIAPRPTPEASPPDPEPSPDDSETDPTSAPTGQPSPARPETLPLDVVLDDVDLRARLGTATGDPIRIRRAELVVGATDRPLGIDRLSGYGTLPDDVPFSLSVTPTTDDSSSAAPLEFAVDASRPAALAPLLGLEVPGDLRFERARLCPECRPTRLCLESVDLRAGPLDVQSPEACARRRGGTVAVRAGEFTILQDGRTWPLRGTAFQLDLLGDPSPFRLRATLDGHDRGRLRLRSRYDPDDEVLASTFRTDRLQLGAIWPPLGLEHTLEGGRMDGSMTVDIYPHSRLARLTGDLGLRDLTLDHEFLAERPVAVDSTRLQLEALTDFRLQHVSLADTHVTLGDLAPLHLTGYASRTHPGVAFELDATATDLDAGRVRDTLPETLAMPALGAEMSGAFHLGVRTAGHTAYPESLHLAVDIGGDVDVARESPHADVPSLAVDGPPSPLLPTLERRTPLPRSTWVDLQSLDDVIPRILIAAEDARFYRHDGFDWGGIRNAMVHNLEQGRLERGGSTITQQVAKNLFLSHRRTLGRKFKELWITWRLEAALDKDRILELYLNLVEWGPGVQGLDAAAAHYFDTTPQRLTIPQMVLLSAIVPGPHLYGPLLERGYLPSSRVVKVKHILNNLRYFELIDQRDYDRLYRSAKRGTIGGLDLTVCRDDKHAPKRAPDCPAP